MLRTKTWLYIALAIVMIFVLSSLAFAQGTPTVQTANNSQLGQIVVDAKNMTLYQFTADTANTSNCTQDCIQAWPPLTVTKGTTPTAGSGVTGSLGTLTRSDDGSTQVTMNQIPLYFFAQDKAAGDVKGQGVAGKWYVVSPSGQMIKTTAGGISAAAQATGTVTATTTVTATAAATATVAATATTAPAATAAVTPTEAATATTAPTTAPTTAAGAAVTTTATAAPPGALPTTGGDSGSSLLLPALLGLLAIAVGGMLGLRAARQAR
jgi:predicted lipoprotein with Yx(FWY)xxD motif